MQHKIFLPLILAGAVGLALCACTATGEHQDWSGSTPAEPPPANVIHNADSQPRSTRLNVPNLPQLPRTGNSKSADHAGAPKQNPIPDTGNERQRAAGALDDINRRINLNNQQTRQLLHLKSLMASGNYEAAASSGLRLDKTLRMARRHYRVQHGDTIGAIAQDIFGNAALWPLILHANAQTISHPGQLRAGMMLSIPLHPTMDQAAAALAETHRYLQSGH